jgi:hypothetical protein
VGRAELRLQLIEAAYRVEGVRQDGADLERIRACCVALVDMTEARVEGDARFRGLVDGRYPKAGG